jgi:hypothetical protein
MADYDVDDQGKLVVRPERQHRRSNLYADALGAAPPKQPSHVAHSFGFSPAVSSPHPFRTRPTATLFYSPTPQYPAYVQPVPAVPPRPSTPQSAPEPFTPEAGFDSFWDESLDATGSFEMGFPGYDMFGI